MSAPINRFEYQLTRVMALLDRPWKIVLAFNLFVLVLSLTIMVWTQSTSLPILFVILAVSSLLGYIIARIFFTYNKINIDTLDELKKVAKELSLRNADLEAFALTAAHDLKTPINSIYGYTHIIIENHNSDPEIYQEAAKQIQLSAKKMSRIIDDMLLLARIGISEVQPEPIQMSEVVESSLDRLAAMVQQAQAEIDYPSDWPVANGHAGWVEEVWINYISNALKYGGDPPKISLGSDVVDGAVRFWVRDNGRGIRPEEQVDLFKEFTRLDHTEAEGHGLGLAIVRRIVDKLQGEVGVESRPGGGSTFYFTLPRK